MYFLRSRASHCDRSIYDEIFNFFSFIFSMHKNNLFFLYSQFKCALFVFCYVFVFVCLFLYIFLFIYLFFILIFLAHSVRTDTYL